MAQPEVSPCEKIQRVSFHCGSKCLLYKEVPESIFCLDHLQIGHSLLPKQKRRLRQNHQHPASSWRPSPAAHFWY